MIIEVARVNGERRCDLVRQSIQFRSCRGRLVDNAGIRVRVWSCSNGKGRCSQDVGGALVCRCNEVRFTDCPKSADILTLYNIVCMPDDTEKTTIARNNLTRSAEKGKKWEPDGDCFICNLHYEGFVGPSRKLPNRIPEYFARPSSSAPVKKKWSVAEDQLGGRPIVK